MKHTVESLMALADVYAEASHFATSRTGAGKHRAALSAALAEALKERDVLKAEVERLQPFSLHRLNQLLIDDKVKLCAERDALKLVVERLQKVVLVISEGWTSLPAGLADKLDAAMKGAA